MDRKTLRNLLMNMRTTKNEAIINNFLGQIDISSELELEDFFKQYGYTEAEITSSIEKIIIDNPKDNSNYIIPSNDISMSKDNQPEKE